MFRGISKLSCICSTLKEFHLLWPCHSRLNLFAIRTNFVSSVRKSANSEWLLLFSFSRPELVSGPLWALLLKKLPKVFCNYVFGGFNRLIKNIFLIICFCVDFIEHNIFNIIFYIKIFHKIFWVIML